MKLRLTLTPGQHVASVGSNTRDFTTTGGTIGRREDCSWVLMDPTRVVSRVHAEISFDDGCFQVIDRSPNGVYLNGAESPLGEGQSAKLQEGTRIRIHDGQFLVEEIDVGAETQTALSPWPVQEDQPDSPPIPFSPEDSHGGVGTWGNDRPNPGVDASGNIDILGEIRVPETEAVFGVDSASDSLPWNFSDLDAVPTDETADPRNPDVEVPTDALAQQGEALRESEPEPAKGADWTRSDGGEWSEIASEPSLDSGNTSSVTQPHPTPAPAPQPILGPETEPPPGPTPETVAEPETGAAPDPIPDPARDPEPETVPESAPELKTEPIPAPQHRHSSQPDVAEPTTAGNADGDKALEALLEGAGVPNLDIPGGASPEFFRMVGELLARYAAGTAEVLQEIGKTKDTFRISQTQVQQRDNNPLRWVAGRREAVARLLAPEGQGYLSPPEAVEDACARIKAHQVGSIRGMEASLRQVLAEQAPDALERHFDQNGRPSFMTSKDAWYWQQYAAHHAELIDRADDSIRNLVFGNAFASAYEQEVRKLRGQKR